MVLQFLVYKGSYIFFNYTTNFHYEYEIRIQTVPLIILITYSLYTILNCCCEFSSLLLTTIIDFTLMSFNVSLPVVIASSLDHDQFELGYLQSHFRRALLLNYLFRIRLSTCVAIRISVSERNGEGRKIPNEFLSLGD